MRLSCFIGTSTTKDQCKQDIIELTALYQLIDEGDTTYKDYRFAGYVNATTYQTGYNSHVTLVTVTQSVERGTNMNFFNGVPSGKLCPSAISLDNRIRSAIMNAVDDFV